MITNLDSRVLDVNYSYYHGSLLNLMRNAGGAVADVVATRFPNARKILVACGSGNKAGDAIFAIGTLKNKYAVKFFFIKGKSKIRNPDIAKSLYKLKPEIVAKEYLSDAVRDSDLIIDALLGTGIKGDPSPDYAEVMDLINGSRKPIVSIDVPSGIGTKKQILPKITVALHDVKHPCTAENSGEIVIRDIGIPPELGFTAGPGDILRYPLPEKNSHKGMNGKLAVIAGLTYPGAGIVSSLGAEKTGIDLLNLYTSETFVDAPVHFSPFIIPHVLDLDLVDQQLSSADSVLIGPGLGMQESNIELISKVLSEDVATVIDADGLKLLPLAHYSRKRPLIVTPHAKEFEIMAGMEPSEENVMRYAREHNSVVLLKGPTDLISDGNSVHRTPGGNARMSMGGTGDLLAGIVAGLLSKRMEPLHAARLGSFINKKCGERAFEKLSYWYGITDMLVEIPATMKWCFDFATGR